jgi:predicted RecB family nuclease
VITDDFFASFLKCPTKSHLESSKSVGVSNEIIDWHAQVEQSYRGRVRARLAYQFGVPEPLSGTSCIDDLKSGRYPLVIGSVVRVEGLQSNIDALEWIRLGIKRKQGYYIPIRTNPREKLTREDKFLLAFDAIVLSLAVGQVPAFGRIIHGKDFRVLKVKLPGLMKAARQIVQEIAKQHASNDAPPPVLNRHCAQCPFRAPCRKAAEERDDLSLLSNMSKGERTTLQKKGIFSVHQL